MIEFINILEIEFEKADEYYQKVREIDKEGNLKDILDILMKSNKG